MTAQGIMLKDKKNGFILVHLRDILRVFDEGKDYCWGIYDFELIHCPKFDRGFNGKLHQIENLVDGYPLSWDELKFLANVMFQVVEGKFIASKNIDNIRKYESEEEIYENCELVIQMRDNQFWEIHIENEALLDKIKKRFSWYETLNV